MLIFLFFSVELESKRLRNTIKALMPCRNKPWGTAVQQLMLKKNAYVVDMKHLMILSLAERLDLWL